jgi:hypothetical protein
MALALNLRPVASGSLALLLATPALALGPGAPFEPPRAAPLAADADPAAAAPAGLTGVRVAGAGAAALIDGRWWPLGSMPRGARLVAVQGHQALLRHADGRVEALVLHPSTSPPTGATRAHPRSPDPAATTP